MSRTFDMQEGFGELRSILARPWGFDELFELLWMAYQTDPQVYREKWLSYLEAQPTQWEEDFYGECGTWQDFTMLIAVAPFTTHVVDITDWSLEEVRVLSDTLLRYVMSLQMDGMNVNNTLEKLDILGEAPDAQKLKGLYISNTYLSMYLTDRITHFAGLRELFLDANAIDEEDVWNMGQRLQWTKLSSLSLRCNHLEDDGAIELGAWGPKLPHLKYLSVSSNRIGAIGLEALVTSNFYQHLEELDVSSNHIDDEGVQCLLRHINTSVKIHLYGNPLSQDCMDHLEKMGLQIQF